MPTRKMILQKVNPFLEYVEQSNEISVQIFEVHVKLIVDNEHGQVQSKTDCRHSLLIKVQQTSLSSVSTDDLI